SAHPGALSASRKRLVAGGRRGRKPASAPPTPARCPLRGNAWSRAVAGVANLLRLRPPRHAVRFAETLGRGRSPGPQACFGSAHPGTLSASRKRLVARAFSPVAPPNSLPLVAQTWGRSRC